MLGGVTWDASPGLAPNVSIRMRWKLLLVTSSLAALAGAGASLGLAYGLLGAVERVRAPNDAAALAVLAVPLAVITAASIFVYRHTARLRPLQAALTAMLSAALTLGLILAGSPLLPQRTPPQPPRANRDSD